MPKQYRARPDRICEGTGTRVAPTGSTSLPEVECPECDHYAPPVREPGDRDRWMIRSHRTVHDPD